MDLTPEKEAKMTETIMQAVLMRWAMVEKHHIFVVPNSTVIYPWESDLISATKAFYTHEYEIKVSLSDYRRDGKKMFKHGRLANGVGSPNYFWYVTFNFDIDPPEHAGWMKITKGKYNYAINIMKEAPRLNENKMSNDQQIDVARLLSFRISNYYGRYLSNPSEIEAQFIAGLEAST